MDYQQIVTWLNDMAEPSYAKFSSDLTPGAGRILGVRIPKLRALAKRLAKEDFKVFLAAAKEDTFEEIMLQGFVIGYAQAELSELLPYVKEFIPKIHNWAVNDSFCSTFKIAAKMQAEVWDFLMGYLDSKEEFELRVVAVMLMNYYLNEEYIDRVLEIYKELGSGKRELAGGNKNVERDADYGNGAGWQVGYYLEMGVAWGIATAFARFPDKTMHLLKSGELNEFTYKKSIQKMIESYRVSEEDKKILRDMRKNVIKKRA